MTAAQPLPNHENDSFDEKPIVRNDSVESGVYRVCYLTSATKQALEVVKEGAAAIVKAQDAIDEHTRVALKTIRECNGGGSCNGHDGLTALDEVKPDASADHSS